jgi:hypothetical protein
MAVLGVVGVASAQNVPAGLTGLWQFATDANRYQATIGTDLATTFPGAAWFTGPYTQIGTTSNPNLYSDNGVLQELPAQYMTMTHNVAPNGGAYVNNYTVMMDYIQTTDSGYNSLLQTNMNNTNDGDLFIKAGADRAHSTIGIGDAGYSSATFDAGQWHRIALSVSNGNFFRVYLDGNIYLDGTPQSVDGRFALDPQLLLFADEDGEEAWGLVGTVAVWDHALNGNEIGAMGGWIGGATEPTPLVTPEPATLGLFALAGLACWRRRKA